MTTYEPLYPFQRDAAKRAEDGQIYLGFDMGLGKSRTALEIAKRRGAKRLLVVCQASGRYVWEAEVAKWTGGRATIISGVHQLAQLRGPGIFVVSYGLISQRESPFVSVIVKGEPFDMTVLDEAAAVKNSKANRTKAILGRMLPKLGYVLPLSGTPAPNHAGELYPILKALHPSAIAKGNGRQMMEWEFEDAYCKVVRKRFGNGPEVRVIMGSQNIADLRERLDGFMVRVRKDAVLRDLPPVRYDVVPLAIASALQQSPALLATIDGLSDEDILKYLSGASGDEHIMRLRHQLGLAKAGPATEYIDDFLTNLAEPKKLLVFAHHKDVIAHLAGGLADWSPAIITGASTPPERALAVDRFLGKAKPDTRLLIGNIQAAGTGLTLVGPSCRCSDVIFVEATYSVGDNVQAAARVHRIGQSEAVVARFLTAHGTLDDRIQAILARKAQDFAALFN